MLPGSAVLANADDTGLTAEFPFYGNVPAATALMGRPSMGVQPEAAEPPRLLWRLWDAPNSPSLLFAMLQQGLIEYEENVDLSGSPSMSAWCAIFVPDQDVARARIGALLEEFRQEFEHLAAMPPKGPASTCASS